MLRSIERGKKGFYYNEQNRKEGISSP